MNNDWPEYDFEDCGTAWKFLMYTQGFTDAENREWIEWEELQNWRKAWYNSN